MIRLLESTKDDISQLAEWIEADPWHHNQGQPEWWLTGNGALSFCLQDDKGPLCYVRLDQEGELIRLHTQFAPYDEVNKIRLVRGMIKCLPMVEKFARDSKANGIIFKSSSAGLIQFMKKWNKNFKEAQNDDYVLTFGAT